MAVQLSSPCLETCLVVLSSQAFRIQTGSECFCSRSEDVVLFADTGELAGVDESFHDILAGSLLAVKLSNPCLLAGSIRLAIHQSVVEHLYELIVAGVLLDVLIAEDEALGNFFTAVCTARKLIYPCSQTLFVRSSAENILIQACYESFYVCVLRSNRLFISACEQVLYPLAYALSVYGVVVVHRVLVVCIVAFLTGEAVQIASLQSLLTCVYIVIRIVNVEPGYYLGYGVVGLAPLLKLPGLQSGCSYVAVDPLFALACLTIQVLNNFCYILLNCGVVAIGLAVEHPYSYVVLYKVADLFLGPLAKAAVCQSSVYLRSCYVCAQVTVALYIACDQIGTHTDYFGGDQSTLRVTYAYDLILIYIPVSNCIIQSASDFLGGKGDVRRMYVYAHDDGFGERFMPLGHHDIIYGVVAQVGGRCVYACLSRIGQLPVAYAAAALIEDYRVLLCALCVISFRIDYLYRNLAFGTHQLVHDGITFSIPAYIYHLQLDITQTGLILDIRPDRAFDQVAHSIGGRNTILCAGGVNIQDQIQVLSGEAALTGQVRVDGDTQLVVRILASEEDIALSIHVPAGGGQSAEGIAAAIAGLIAALIDGQSYYIACYLNVSNIYFAEIRICGTTVIQSEVCGCQSGCIYVLCEGYGNGTYLVAVEVLNDGVLNICYIILQMLFCLLVGSILCPLGNAFCIYRVIKFICSIVLSILFACQTVGVAGL